MLETVCLEFHGKRHTDFDLKRIARAQAQGFDEPVTAYLCGVFIKARAGVGIVFGHQRKDKYGRFGDGHLIRTSDVLNVSREGRFWVMTTVNSRYVIATFSPSGGLKSLRDFQQMLGQVPCITPQTLQ